LRDGAAAHERVLLPSQAALAPGSENRDSAVWAVVPEAAQQQLRGVADRLISRLALLEQANRCGSSSHVHLARETLEVCVPLADRLGMTPLRQALEDTCFSILEPGEHDAIKHSLSSVLPDTRACLHALVSHLEQLSTRHALPAQVEGRVKSLYSLYRKLCNRRVPIVSMTDIVGARIIVETVEQCYATLDLVTELYQPLEDAVDDRIATPKRNGYRSIHVVVPVSLGSSQMLAELQIRTWSMHLEAACGAAAHWRYKTHSRCRRQAERVQGDHGSLWCCTPCGCVLHPELGSLDS